MKVTQIRPPIFNGPFAELCKDFIDFKQSLGYKYYTVAEVMTMFDRFSMDYDADDSKLTKELVSAWVEHRPGETISTQICRITAIRQFAIYLSDLGHEAYIYPLKATAGRKQYVPYIFTKDELTAFFRAADNQKPVGQYPNAHIVHPLLFRILYGCGLRISEAIALKVEDVDFEKGILRIIDSKFGRDRLIPLSGSLRTRLHQYASIMDLNQPDYYVFPSRNNAPMSKSGAYGRFRQILWQAGISHGGRGHGPRMHDFRHTFAVHSLNQLIKQGFDLSCALPLLAAYLGHEKLSTTQQYVRLTAEMFPDITKLVENMCSCVFEEVQFHENH